MTEGKGKGRGGGKGGERKVRPCPAKSQMPRMSLSTIRFLNNFFSVMTGLPSAGGSFRYSSKVTVEILQLIKKKERERERGRK